MILRENVCLEARGDCVQVSCNHRDSTCAPPPFPPDIRHRDEGHSCAARVKPVDFAGKRDWSCQAYLSFIQCFRCHSQLVCGGVENVSVA